MIIYCMGMAYAAQGKRAEALQIVKEMEQMSVTSLHLPQLIARIYATLSEKELALAWLKRGFEAGAVFLFYKDEPVWDTIRSEQRFRDLLQRMGIPL